MFGALKNIAGKFADGLKAEVEKFANRDFLDAAVAGGYVIAAADGSIDDDEIEGLLAVLKVDDSLSVFSETDILTVFNEMKQVFSVSPPMGKKKAREKIEKMSGNADYYYWYYGYGMGSSFRRWC